jgi:hypothetical protein
MNFVKPSSSNLWYFFCTNVLIFQRIDMCMKMLLKRNYFKNLINVSAVKKSFIVFSLNSIQREDLI